MPAFRINVGLVVNPEMRGSRADSSIDGSDAPSANILMRSSEMGLGMSRSSDKSARVSQIVSEIQSHLGSTGIGPRQTERLRTSLA